ncbi:MAG: hypothetical protein JWO30_956 [Fibrobacteres bacterium]|nr:hypothetical protein [Fibrobacterota bacterium]
MNLRHVTGFCGFQVLLAVILLFSLRPATSQTQPDSVANPPDYSPLVKGDTLEIKPESTSTYDANASISTWSRDHATALSLTFDDNSVGQFTYALPMLDSEDMQATFYLITDRMTPENWAIAKVAAAHGHEIGSHTKSHLVLSKETPLNQERQMTESIRTIDSLIPSQKCRTLAYPYGDYDTVTLALAHRHFMAARGVGSYLNSLTPVDMFMVSGRGPQSDTDSPSFNTWLSEGEKKKDWIVEMFHGIEDDGFDPITSTCFHNHLKAIKAKGDVFWVAPFARVVEYIKERECAKAELGAHNDSSLTFTVSDSLPDSLYCEPLTIRIKAPPRWIGVEARQEGGERWSVVRSSPDGAYLLFEAIPDQGPVILTGRLEPAKTTGTVKQVEIPSSISPGGRKASGNIEAPIDWVDVRGIRTGPAGRRRFRGIPIRGKQGRNPVAARSG